MFLNAKADEEFWEKKKKSFRNSKIGNNFILTELFNFLKEFQTTELSLELLEDICFNHIWIDNVRTFWRTLVGPLLHYSS